MADIIEPDTTDVEADVLITRAGLVVPPERRAAIIAGYRELRAMAALLREAGLEPADEPANIYAFDPILRSA